MDTSAYQSTNWQFLRIEQAIMPHLKEGTLGYLLIEK